MAAAARSDTIVDYRIQAGELGEALQAWAIQSHAQMLYPPELVRGRTSRGLQGRHAPGDALAILLKDTGIGAEATGPTTWLLRRPPAPVAAATPPAMPRAVEADMPPRQLGTISIYSRSLRRIAAESSIPVTTITRSEIDSGGYLSLFDLLRAQPGVQVTNQPELMGGNSAATFQTGAAGAASVGLRRLGAKATLILVNGRRMPGYGLAADATGSVADVSSIPLAMVERIDILRDGASTLYGADAMAGVIDISLRKDFTGGEAGFVYGLSSRHDVAHRQVSGMSGTRYANGGNGVLMFDLLERDPLQGRDRDWYSLDRRRDGLLDARSIYSFPGNRQVIDDNGDAQLQSRAGCRVQDLDMDGACRDDRAKATTLATGKTAGSVRGYFTFPAWSGAEIYADAGMTATRQRQQSAPTSALITIPADDGGAASQQVYHAFWDVGAIRQTTLALLSRLYAGVRHDGPSWSWDVGVGTEQSRVEDTIRGLVNRDGFVAAATTHAYRFDQRPAAPAIAALLAPPVTNTGHSETSSLVGTASGDLAEWQAGTLRLDTGIDLRHENLRHDPDASLVSGDLLIAEPASRFEASRRSGALHAYLDAPVAQGVNVDVGVRLEHTDRHGSFTAPALAMRWTPWKALLLRAGSAQGRRVPTLLEQRGLDESGGSSTYEYWTVPPSLTPCALPDEPGSTRCLLELRPTSGPPLRAEQSRSVNVGFVWEPWTGFNLSVDVYQLRRDGEIDLIPIAYALQHPDAFPGFTVRDDDGNLVALNSHRVNLGSTTTRGVDVEMRWDMASTRQGDFAISLAANHLARLSFRATPDSASYDRAGHSGQPRSTAAASLHWSRGDWKSTLNLRFTGGYAYTQYAGDQIACPSYRAEAGKCSTPAFTLTNLNVAYAGWPEWRFAFNIANLFDHRPRYYTESSGGYNPLFDDPIGRYFSISASRRY